MLVPRNLKLLLESTVLSRSSSRLLSSPSLMRLMTTCRLQSLPDGSLEVQLSRRRRAVERERERLHTGADGRTFESVECRAKVHQQDPATVPEEIRTWRKQCCPMLTVCSTQMFARGPVMSCR